MLLPIFLETRSRNSIPKTGMSSTRSRSGAIWIGITFRR